RGLRARAEARRCSLLESTHPVSSPRGSRGPLRAQAALRVPGGDPARLVLHFGVAPARALWRRGAGPERRRGAERPSSGVRQLQGPVGDGGRAVGGAFSGWFFSARLNRWLAEPQHALRVEILRIGAPLAILGFMASRVAHADEWLG